MSQDSSSPHDKNPFTVLGLQGTEDLPAIRKAFLAIAAKSHPDRLRMKSPEEKAQALEIFLYAKKAFETLSQPDKRREWSEKLARPSTPVATPAAVAPRPAPALTPSRTPSAPVLPAEPRSASSRGGPLPSAMALQIHKMGMAALESSDYAKALDLFSKAAKVSPTPRHQAMELVARGHQYLSTRFFDRARESFERALQLLPDCREARAGLELIDKQSGRYKR